ncbi:hypothetical protein GCM10010277_84770 [Streptomyces longisporoflavus]|uniref:hypothetical protein n=1 Tax=Streptomyces longisporoflavus TaxID=28044 RepID=UPI0019BED5B8|nr:hypothetical protein [Streptomyces longisporoflavus]GGV72172.1 hypothetical protein GCM10010277_84770 [Streptomyces longisporoflavus]
MTIRLEAAPANVDISDWGALHWTGSAHRYEQLAGTPYYEEPEARAATFLYLALVLRPFADYNLVIGWSAAQAYMELSGWPVAPEPQALWALAGEIRAGEAGLRDAATTIRTWRTGSDA